MTYHIELARLQRLETLLEVTLTQLEATTDKAEARRLGSKADSLFGGVAALEVYLSKHKPKDDTYRLEAERHARLVVLLEQATVQVELATDRAVVRRLEHKIDALHGGIAKQEQYLARVQDRGILV